MAVDGPISRRPMMTTSQNRMRDGRHCPCQHAFGTCFDQIHIAWMGHYPEGSIVNCPEHRLGSSLRLDCFGCCDEPFLAKGIAFDAARSIAFADADLGSNHARTQHRNPDGQLFGHRIGQKHFG